MSDLRLRITLLLTLGALFVFQGAVVGQEFRPIDGQGVHPTHPDWGATNSPMITIAAPSFSDGYAAPSGVDRPNPREISNAVFAQSESILDPANRSDFVFVWGQFVDHDITLSPDGSTESLDIAVPKGDKYFDPKGTGTAVLPMHRSDYIKGTGTDITNPRKYYNGITAYHDASNVYGSTLERSNWLRSFKGGKLRTSKGNLLPWNTLTGEEDGAIDPDAPEMAMPFPFIKKYFVAGDVRANENPLLTALHTLFMREHNRLCDVLAAEHSDWNDQQLYMKAREIVSAELQSITYQQWMDALGLELAPYAGYDENTNPQMTNVFSTAAYRFGHSTINSKLYFLKEDGSLQDDGIAYLRQNFFNPKRLKDHGIAAALRGMTTQVAQDNDTKMINDLRNFLFGAPGSGGVDLASANINRGRDRGLPTYNDYREAMRLPRLERFDQFSESSAADLASIYKSVDDVDPWVGFLAEKKADGEMFGETLKAILKRQFEALRDGDRFYFEIDPGLTEAERAEVKNTTLTDIIVRNTDAEFMPENVFYAQHAYAEVRSIDGSNNNIAHPNWGAVGEAQQRLTTIAYADGISAPAGPDRPNPRNISNKIFAQEGNVEDPLRLSDYNFAWGQFIDHDITFVPDSDKDPAMIAVPECDEWFDPNCEGRAIIPMMRSEAMPGTGTDVNNPRQVYNGITAFMDGSTIYGSNKDWANWLRTFKDGKLKTSKGNLLPYNTYSGEYDDPIDPSAPKLANPNPNVTKYFVSGDIRCNENPLLTSMHTLFMREHNRKCDELKAQHPDWTDEQLYQKARKWVGGLIEALAYEEWLPTIGVKLPPYQGYNPNMHPQIFNVFSAAAYRYGHSTINSALYRMDDDGNHMPDGDILLRDAFFNPTAIAEMGDIDPYLKGMSAQVEQDFDTKIIDDLRNFLFGAPGDGGMDLAAININRGRERGLPDYNTIRKDFGLAPVRSFADITTKSRLRQQLAETYGSVDNIDPWVGMLAEDHGKDELFGELVMRIVTQQFQALRDGDRFYYENDPGLTKEEKAELKRTTFGELIMRNTGLTTMKENVFLVDESLIATEDVSGDHPVQLAVTPNPAVDMVEVPVSVKDGEEVSIKIFDVNGKLQKYIPAQKASGQVLKINVSTLQKGVYLIQQYTGSGVAAQGKLIKA